MSISHNSRDTQDRKPTGARSVGEVVQLTLNVKFEDEVKVFLHYVYGLKTFQKSMSRMNRLKMNSYTCELKLPSHPGLFFYWFEIIEEGKTQYYVRYKAEDSTGYLADNPPQFDTGLHTGNMPFQITVFDSDFKTPDWTKGAIMYQIMPDRFSRSQDFSYDTLITQKQGDEYIFHEDWNGPLDYHGKTEEGYLACDFYGGSLSGIREKLDYLQYLYVDVIYLNPIFLARSNHRYDTANYLEIDNILGNLEDFKNLCTEAKARGIRIILDGVFSHTGSDSIYFNKYGRFPGVGAFQDAVGIGISSYRYWYNIDVNESEINYASWWGFSELPNINKSDLSYRNFILGDNGVIEYWLKQGASGFRIDVSDELPDDFLEEIYKKVKDVNQEAIILGEIWEDASNKVSYGSYRNYVFGSTHDSTMCYPYKNAVLDFLKQSISGEELENQLASLRENYPTQMLYSTMCLLSSHDLPRALTVLADAPYLHTREEQASYELDIEKKHIGIQRLKLAYLFTFFYPGMISIYYGDEIGMNGYTDPFNRRPFQWDSIDQDLKKRIGIMTHLRKKYPVLRTGYYKTLIASGGHFAYIRYLKENRDAFDKRVDGPIFAILMINRDSDTWYFSKEEQEKIKLYLPNEITELKGGTALTNIDDAVRYWGGTTEE